MKNIEKILINNKNHNNHNNSKKNYKILKKHKTYYNITQYFK